MAKKNRLWKVIVVAGLLGVVGWAVFDLFRMLIKDLIDTWFGITNPYYGTIAVIFISLIMLFIFGMSFRKSIKRAL